MSKQKILAGTAALALLLGFAGCAPWERQPATQSPTSAPDRAPVGTQVTLEAPEPIESIFWTQQAAAAPQAAPPSAVILKGKPNAAAQTLTQLEPLPVRPVVIADPGNSKGLPNKKVAHAFGVAQNGQAHQISVDFQRFFESKGYAAAVYDTTPGTKAVYLTFDCGYENGYTAKVLDVLKEKQVPAAFFCTLDEIKGAPEIIARMIAEGHIVGNHSTTHASFAAIDRSAMAREILESDNYLRTQFGYSAPFFRFPKGEYNESALDAVASLGFSSIFWSLAYDDWDVSVSRGGDYAAEKVISRLHPGAIILLHSVSKDNAQGMRQIIDRVRAAGYQFQDLTKLPLFHP
ncbi:MAG: polysaccharide deacetylase family protein [Oscillospiraceae bacterium]|jgi:peptidoglycan-N-acetylmuramic acid deacetylase|nr:polysaccharide deacetylase family protein [Oscillospiraceae bacterium]